MLAVRTVLHPSERGGLGLGLVVANEIVDLHERLDPARQRADGGAVFRVELPR
jgi:C4-dicarboxylate-specific signal transduction histidine kinase